MIDAPPVASLADARLARQEDAPSDETTAEQALAMGLRWLREHPAVERLVVVLDDPERGPVAFVGRADVRDVVTMFESVKLRMLLGDGQ